MYPYTNEMYPYKNEMYPYINASATKRRKKRHNFTREPKQSSKRESESFTVL